MAQWGMAQWGMAQWGMAQWGMAQWGEYFRATNHLCGRGMA
jgi:hypothetical protein